MNEFFTGLALDSEIWLLFMAGGAVLLITLFAWQTFAASDPMSARLRGLSERGVRSAVRDGRQRKNQFMSEGGTAGQFLKKFKLLRTREAEKISMRLARAGYRSRNAFVAYQFMRLVAPFATAALAVISIVWLQLYPLAEEFHAPAAMIAALIGWKLPDIYLRNVTQKRQAEMRKGVPDALDLMVICAEAGLSLDAALSRVAREIAGSAPEIADELGLTAVELNFMPDRQHALANLIDRTMLPSVRALVGTMRQSERYGTPLAQSLRVLALEMRDERMMRAEEKAARLPAILTVPMIIFILPPLFIVLLGPAILRTIDAFRGLGS
jgi:tight adherence protein C